MQCPICRKKFVKTYAEGIKINRCPACNGIWFKEGEIFDFLKRSTEKNFDEIKIKEPPKIETEPEKAGFCPKCNKLLDRHKISAAAGANVDKCLECGGLFVGFADLSHVEYLYCQEYWPKIHNELTRNKYKDFDLVTEGSFWKGFLGLIEDENPRKNFPWATVLIIIFNTLMLLLSLSNPEGMRELCLIPKELLSNPLPHSPKILSSMFSHAGFAHLIGNMYFLWIFGDNLEDILGSIKYAVLYLFFGIAAGVVYSFLTRQPEIPMLGASGAVAGVMGGYLFLYPKAKLSFFTHFLFKGFKVNLPAWFYLGVWFFGMQILSTALNIPGVAWWAHLAGFVAGYLTLLILKKSGNV
jgi:membrane associated rhomboid family serine protease